MKILGFRKNALFFLCQILIKIQPYPDGSNSVQKSTRWFSLETLHQKLGINYSWE